MRNAASPLAAFHRIGDRSGLQQEHAEHNDLRPALFGLYSDLSQLRYDYPVVLCSTPGSGPWVKSLTDIIDGILQEISEPGAGGDEARRQLLAQEQLIRSLLESGQKGSLSLFWEAARRELAGTDAGITPESPAGQLNERLVQAGKSLGIDGEITNCDNDLAAKLIKRAWQESELRKAQLMRTRIDRLAQKLADILEVDYQHSAKAREADQLESTMGSGDRTVFDFQAMAKLLKSAPSADPLPALRRQRIEAAISVLRTQKFFSPASISGAGTDKAYKFDFNDCATALETFRERLPEVAALVRALSIAELEIDNHYDEAHHDPFFTQFDESRLGPGDLQLFPDYLVYLDEVKTGEQAEVFEILQAGLPFKIIAQTGDILGKDTIANGQLALGTYGQQLARMAMGLGHAFVMQAASSSLYRLQESVLQGLSNDRPALFSIYSGPGYLASAAATESRAFPCFVYNPANGPDQLSRFDLAANPRPGEDWVEHNLLFEGGDHERLSQQSLFNLVDFIASDPRFSSHFAPVSKEQWGDEMIAMGEFLKLDAAQRPGKVPYVLLIDDQNVLCRAVADEKLIDATLRCRDVWRSLQELGGINNSHAAAALVQAQQAWDEEKEQLLAQASGQAPLTESAPLAPQETPAPATEAAPVSAAEEEATPSSDDPWIETIRCTTCNECTELNDRMFAYNEDMRAYVADPDAGTYRELVEAAETCQVAIIHPGKPRNEDEAGLEELQERAEPFM